MTTRPTGLTKDAGWQVGVSRTLPIEVAAAWDYLLSPAGLAHWLGDGVPTPLEKGITYKTTDGTTGQIRSLHPRDRVRLTWRPPGRRQDAIARPPAAPCDSLRPPSQPARTRGNARALAQRP